MTLQDMQKEFIKNAHALYGQPKGTETSTGNSFLIASSRGYDKFVIGNDRYIVTLNVMKRK